AKSTCQQGIDHLMAEGTVRPAPRAASRARRNPRSASAGDPVFEMRHRVINARIADGVRSYEGQHRRGFS
ncbi:MAG: hypothetical protein Q8Q80_14090, partial [Methyloversatilis sp.]|uniref:hypothetical protein n=1 Tax=Methyloversatilis sp. TaxID=2569862 RepID=UPI002732C1DF